jgi:hypothetical protein
LNTLGRIIDGFLWPSDIYLQRNKRKKKKTALFHFCSSRGSNPRPTKKWQKRLFRDPPSLVPRSGASPGLRRLSRGRGKYIFKVQLIFIAENFLISDPPVVGR